MSVLSRLLCPKGRLYIHEEHPVMTGNERPLEITTSYFREQPEAGTALARFNIGEHLHGTGLLEPNGLAGDILIAGADRGVPVSFALSLVWRTFNAMPSMLVSIGSPVEAPVLKQTSMKSSVYKLSDGVYLADMEGRRIMRGSVADLAAALAQEGIKSENLLLGDWRADAALLSSSEQNELSQAMAAQ